MKKMFGLLIIMTLLYFAIQFGFKFIEKGHVLDYKVTNGENVFKINETYVVNTKNESDNYYFSININDKINFNYQTFANFNMQGQVITDIKYYEDDVYTCILPIFTNDKVITDIICKKGDNYIFYNYIKGTDASLDVFASSLAEYKTDNFVDEKEQLTNSGLTIAYNSLLEDHFLALENYKGIYTLNNVNLSKLYNLKLLDTDVYEKELSAFANKYYLMADYTEDTKFNEFTLVNIANNSKSTIKYDYDISLDSYVQGVIGSSVYIFDRDTLRQYEVNVKTKTIIEVGNTEVGIKKYINGAFVNVNAYDAVSNNIKFNAYSTDNTFNGKSYALVEKTGIAKSGYYYIYEAVGSSYKVYRSSVQDGINLTYLFTTDNINNIVYYKDFVYYIEGNSIRRFSDKNLIETVMDNSELSFNKDLKFNVYFK